MKFLAPIIVVGAAFAILIVSFQDDTNSFTASDVPPDYSSELKIMETNGIKHLVPLDKIKGGGPPKDGIPSIDDPVFAMLSESQFMSDSDTVIGIRD